MKLSSIGRVQSGHLNREIIEPRKDGTHFLLQARDVDAHRLTYRTDKLIRFNPIMSRTDSILKAGDMLFMARGSRNFSVILKAIPDPVLAAACFFIFRVSNERVLPDYLCWYLNQPQVERYLIQHSGRGVHMPVVRRSVLENIDVPIPTLEIQKKIMETQILMKEEQALLNNLAEKRKELIMAACLQAVRGSKE
jgi:restriction endonuclease S subunit